MRDPAQSKRGRRWHGISPLLAVFLATPLLAGCTSSPDDAETGASTNLASNGAHDPVPLARQQVITTADNGGEPSLAIAPDGTLYTFTKLALWRSTDEGASWSRLIEPFPGPYVDPHVTADADGVVWISAMHPMYASFIVATSDDRGETWLTRPLAHDLVGGDRQWIIATGGGEAFMAYHRQPEFDPVVLHTTDRGLTWTRADDHALWTSVPEQRSWWFGDGFLNHATGALWFTAAWYHDHNGDATCVNADCYNARRASAWVSRDQGDTWRFVHGPEIGYDTLDMGMIRGTADQAGTVYLAWHQPVTGSTGIFLTSTPDDGETWTTPIRIDDDPGSKTFASLTAGSPGNVAISYYAAETPGIPDTLPDDATWTTRMTWIPDMAQPTTRTHSTLSAGIVKHGVICTQGASCPREDREFLEYLALEALPDGRIGGIHNVMPQDGVRDVDMRNWFTLTEEALLVHDAAHAPLPPS